VRNVLLALFGVVAFGPLVALATVAFQQLLDPQTRAQLLAAGPSIRQVLLLLRSAAFALSVAAGATVLGVVAASALWQWSRGVWRHWRWWFLLLLFIPPYLQAQAWLSALAMTSAALGGATGVASASGGLAAWWAEVMLYAPLTAGLALLGLCSVEPLTNVDAAAQDRLVALLSRWQHECGAAMIYVSHCLSEAQRLCPRVLVLDDGQLRPSSSEDLASAPEPGPQLPGYSQPPVSTL